MDEETISDILRRLGELIALSQDRDNQIERWGWGYNTEERRVICDNPLPGSRQV